MSQSAFLTANAFPVVVEVGEDLDPGSPGGNPALPFLELGLGVVPAAPSPPVVKAYEGPVCRQLVRLEGPLRVIADHESDPVLPQHGVDLRHEPARMPEFEAVPAGRQLRERGGEALVVSVEVGRELPEDGPSFGERTSGSIRS